MNTNDCSGNHQCHWVEYCEEPEINTTFLHKAPIRTWELYEKHDTTGCYENSIHQKFIHFPCHTSTTVKIWFHVCNRIKVWHEMFYTNLVKLKYTWNFTNMLSINILLEALDKNLWVVRELWESSTLRKQQAPFSLANNETIKHLSY